MGDERRQPRYVSAELETDFKHILRTGKAVPKTDQRLARVHALWKSLTSLKLSREELKELIRLAKKEIQKRPRTSGRPLKSARDIKNAEGFLAVLQHYGYPPQEQAKMLQKHLHISTRTVSRRKDKTRP